MELQTYYSVDTDERLYGDPPNITEHAAFREYMDRKNRERKLARISTKPKPKRPAKKRRKSKLRREKSTLEMKWLKDLICPFVYAEKTPDGIRPSVTKEAFIGRWNMKMGQSSLPNYKLLDHFQGKETLYFMGQGWSKADRTLVMIDIDVQKSKKLGTPEGARRFAEHLKTIWPNLYFETSTNGLGIHGYAVLWKRRADAQRTNDALKRFEAWLRSEAKKINADIEQVEIKGTCLDLTLDGRFCQAVKFGVPAKLPRDSSRFSEWQNTTVLRVHDLESAVYDVIETKVTIDTAMTVNEPVAVVPFPIKEIVSGSVSNRFIDEEQLASIPAFEKLYREWVGPKDLMAGKFRVTAHDFAVAMVLLRHFKADGNCDKTLPCRRVEELWAGLYESGDVDRGWNHHRWKVIRDFLSAQGHIDWTDHRYEPPISGGTDQKKSNRGIACKWSISDEYDHWLQRMSLTITLKTGEASFVDTKINKIVPSQGKGKNLRPMSCQLRALRFLERADQACELLFAA